MCSRSLALAKESHGPSGRPPQRVAGSPPYPYFGALIPKRLGAWG
jgi:hypothetical protein